MLFHALAGRPQPRKHFPLLVQQLYVVGVQSSPSYWCQASSSAWCSPAGLQRIEGFRRRAEPGASGFPLLLRELGPVVTALLFAGRAGSALTAEIGLMKATEQLSSLEMMAVDPLRRVVAPASGPGSSSMPLLAFMFSLIGIFGGKLVGVDWLGVDEGSFWSAMQASVDWQDDIMQGAIKSLIFALVVTWIALFNGYDAKPTSAGISQATTRTVVHSSLAVLGLDFILTAVMFG